MSTSRLLLGLAVLAGVSACGQASFDVAAEQQFDLGDSAIEVRSHVHEVVDALKTGGLTRPQSTCAQNGRPS